MKMILRATLVGTMVAGLVGLGACDSKPPRASSPVDLESSKTLTDVVRDALVDVVLDDDAFSRARRFGTLLPTLGPDAMPAVKQLLEDLALRTRMGTGDVELLVRCWATHQPEEASRWAVERSAPGHRLAAVFSSLPVWAEVDPQAALLAAKEWTAREDVRDPVQAALVRGWYRANPKELEKFIHDLGISWARQRLLASYVRAFVDDQGVETVMRWAESVPDDDVAYKLGVFRHVASSVTMNDPEAGLRWCEAHCDGPYGEGMRKRIAISWLWRDAPATVEWLSKAPEGPDKNLALRTAFKQWLDWDREAALDWMATHQVEDLDPWLQPMLRDYTRALAKESPAEAIHWAEQIENEWERQFVTIQIARAWRKLDEAANEAWLAQSGLSEEAKAEVRATQPKGLKRAESEEGQSAAEGGQLEEEGASAEEDGQSAEEGGPTADAPGLQGLRHTISSPTA